MSRLDKLTSKLYACGCRRWKADIGCTVRWTLCPQHDVAFQQPMESGEVKK